MSNFKKKYLFYFVILLPVALGVGASAYSIIKWKTYIWLPAYLKTTMNSLQFVAQGETVHVFLIIADHYEQVKV